MLTFTPPRPPQPGTGRQTTYRVRRAPFGSGVEHRAADGLNGNQPEVLLSWPVLLPVETAAITGFMDARGGVQAFEYTLPGEDTPRRFTVIGYSESDGAASDALTVSLREVADL